MDPRLLKRRVENDVIRMYIFILTQIGNAKFYLGIKIERPNEGFFLVSQNQHINSNMSRQERKAFKNSNGCWLCCTRSNLFSVYGK